MEWTDIFMGLWNGLTAWIVLIVHIFGGWSEYPVYDIARGGNWYDFGFLAGRVTDSWRGGRWCKEQGGDR